MTTREATKHVQHERAFLGLNPLSWDPFFPIRGPAEQSAEAACLVVLAAAEPLIGVQKVPSQSAYSASFLPYYYVVVALVVKSPAVPRIRTIMLAYSLVTTIQ